MLTLRMPVVLFERADALVPPMDLDASAPVGRSGMTRSIVLRTALDIGLSQLEEKYHIGQK